MTEAQLKEANKIQKELNKLKSFIYNAETLWTGKLSLKNKIKKHIIMMFCTNSYGAIEGMEYELDSTMKDRILRVLYERKKELEDKMNAI